MKGTIGLLSLALLVGAGCDQGDDRLKEKAAIEGDASSKAAIKAENDNLAKKASDMEEDLATRQRFYQAVMGTYEGTMKSAAETISFRITLLPSLPPYTSGRTRQLEEIVSDLNNLYFNVQIMPWDAKDSMSGTGCIVSQVRPDIVRGEINIASEGCKNLVRLRLAEAGRVEESNQETARHLASLAREGKMDVAPALVGEVHPSRDATIYRLTVSRQN